MSLLARSDNTPSPLVMLQWCPAWLFPTFLAFITFHPEFWLTTNATSACCITASLVKYHDIVLALPTTVVMEMCHSLTASMMVEHFKKLHLPIKIQLAASSLHTLILDMSKKVLIIVWWTSEVEKSS